MGSGKKSAQIATFATLLLFFCVFCAGCQYAATLALTGTSMGVAYYYTNSAEKTCSVDLDRMSRATILALTKMGFSISDRSFDEGENKIKAETKKLDIIIKLKEITHKCTKIKVKVRQGIAMDKATALEIVCQAEQKAERLAPISSPLTRKEIELIDGLSPKEAIRQGRATNVPYVVKGKRYVPISPKKARKYRKKGFASWYGHRSLSKDSTYMTANGEVFDPNGLSAAHNYLPLPSYVRVTNLENRRSVIVRVNDRGPFVNGRIIDLSPGAARKLGFYKKGTAKVVIETVKVEG